MKFSELYSNMKPIDDEENGVMRGRSEKPCCECGEPTEYIDICSEAYFCSEECLDKFYDRFDRALQAMYDIQDEF